MFCPSGNENKNVRSATSTFCLLIQKSHNVDESLLLAPTFDKYIILALQLFVFYYLVAKSSKISGETEQLTASVVRMR